MRHPFRHEALFYEDLDDFVGQTAPFIRDGVDAGEPVMVAVSPGKARQLAAALGSAADRVHFVEMAALGRNPACIIPAWREFVGAHVGDGRPARGIGEPVWPGRSPEELVECDHHESLLNLAFGDGPAWWLLCPYDAGALRADVLDAARRNHPHVTEGGATQLSQAYVEPHARPGPFADALPPPAAEVVELEFSGDHLDAVRRFVGAAARRAGLDVVRGEDLVLAVNELATNSLRHGGGQGSVLLWRENGALMCEVRDKGRITHALAGRERPPDDHPGGRGLWLVNHLCDLVQIRSRPDGNVVRLRMGVPARA